jgi:hypothetical protein
MRFRDYLGISQHRQRQLARAMQLILFGLVFVGLERQSPNIIINALLGLGVTFLPATLQRDHEIPMDAGLTLWITAAAFLHAIGIIGIPGTGQSLYGSIPYYDHLTHALSASVVAGVAYATVRAFDEHSDGIHLPPRYMFVFILVFVMAFGVVWEIIEFSVAILGNTTGVGSTGFTQHGLDDTMLDLAFNSIGGIVLGIWGTVYLTDVVDAVRDRLDTREAA